MVYFILGILILLFYIFMTPRSIHAGAAGADQGHPWG